MDFKSLKNQKEELEKELVTLKSNPSAPLPSILQLVELEITRLNEILQKMGENDMPVDVDVDVDVDGLEMIDRVSNEFGLTDSSSVKFLRKQLLREFETMNHCFNPQLISTANLIHKVANRLDQKVSRELMAQMHNAGGSSGSNQDLRQVSVDDSKSQVSVDDPLTVAHKTEGQDISSSPQSLYTLARRKLEWTIDVVIAGLMEGYPQGFSTDRVFELLGRPTKFFHVNINDADIRRLVIQKCNEAIERRDKKLADEKQLAIQKRLADHSKSDSKQD